MRGGGLWKKQKGFWKTAEIQQLVAELWPHDAGAGVDPNAGLGAPATKLWVAWSSSTSPSVHPRRRVSTPAPSSNTAAADCTAIYRDTAQSAIQSPWRTDTPSRSPPSPPGITHCASDYP